MLLPIIILITFYSWVCFNIVGRKLMLVTLRTSEGLPASGYNNRAKRGVLGGGGRRFPCNPKFREFRLVHQMEQTTSVWFNRNIRNQLWRWSTLTGLVIWVGRTEMFLAFDKKIVAPSTGIFVERKAPKVFTSSGLLTFNLRLIQFYFMIIIIII